MKTAESNGKYHWKRDTYVLNLHATHLNLQQIGHCSKRNATGITRSVMHLNLQQNYDRRMDVDVEVVVGDEDERRRQWSSSIRCSR